MNPTVCAVLLANGREEMVARAISSFKSQTYQEKRLLIWDTSPGCGSAFAGLCDPQIAVPDVNRAAFEGAGIGNLRNAANKYAAAHYTTSDTRPEIVFHFDSDDWSHPNRIAEQVALLQSSGADCVGYREMLFWHTQQLSEKDVHGPEGTDAPCDVLDEAWLYSHPMPTYALGTSLCYWRRAWEANPFIDGNQEDWHFIHKVRTVGVQSILTPNATEFGDAERVMLAAAFPRYEPRMIASIHGGNTCSKIIPGADEWRRVPEWDPHCRRIMEGA